MPALRDVPDPSSALAAAIGNLREEARALEARLGVTPALLEEIKPRLAALAARSELFDPSHFPLEPQGPFLLGEDPDGRFALYAAAGKRGAKQPPHNHTTWACIAGIRGAEHNVMYRRVDDRSREGWGRLQRTGEMTIERGRAIGYLPDDFHTIEFVSEEAPLMLHLYGLTLDRLPGRVHFNPADIAERGEGPFRVFGAPPHLKLRQVPATQLAAMLRDGDEIALIDVREEGAFERGHPFAAVNVPLSVLELRIGALVPRLETRIVLVDGGSSDVLAQGERGLAHRAARRLMTLGYRNVAPLRDGLDGWRAAGFEIYRGVNVPSKTFGEQLEHAAAIPSIDVQQLLDWQGQGREVVLLDSRPWDEYHRFTVPGSIDCPGAELVRRVPSIARAPDTPVVVHCAGRTRSILGAQSLIEAGVAGPVYALRDGTMAWLLQGHELQVGADRVAGPPDAQGLREARAAADAMATRHHVPVLDAGAAHAALAQSACTTYLFDVRSPEEYAAGHLPQAVNAPGGQLVQATDRYAAVRGARMLLVCNDGVRSRMTAAWLRRMGWDAGVVDGALAATLVRGSPPDPIRQAALTQATEQVRVLAPTVIARRLADDTAVIIDLRSSSAFRRAHVADARWTTRSRLAAALEHPMVARSGATGRVLVLCADDPELAVLAAADLAAADGAARLAKAGFDEGVAVLAGGVRAWRDAGLPVLGDADGMLHEADDVWASPYNLAPGAERDAAMRAYLDWEVGLLEQLQRSGDSAWVDDDARRITRLKT